MSTTTQTQSARDTILSAVRSDLPMPAMPLPDTALTSGKPGISGGVGYSGSLANIEKVDGFPEPGKSLVPFFKSS